MNTGLRFHHEPDYTLLYVATIGLLLIALTCVAGCGSVELAASQGDGAAGASDPPDGAAGWDGAEMVKLEAGAGGMGGSGGTSGTAGVGGRPLAAGCSSNDQCGSGVCTRDISGNMTCCDHPTTDCTWCVGGYQVPANIGCGPEFCDGADLKTHVCQNGTCTVTVFAAGGCAPDGGGETSLRPLGAGCGADDECTSGVCTTDGSGATSCCDKRSTDPCSVCVGGYLTPKTDGTACGAPSCDSTQRYYQTPACQSGSCVITKIDCCVAQPNGVGGPDWACDATSGTKCGSGIQPIGMNCPGSG